ncbi:hypothetical protein GGS23DRAFT_530895 [Durotheca rogersii]|uniref:uncharacterized protein n=1 Tax=Durotheca rogersii TaxID=419775 RepID=UPI00221EA38A|nr:uncharacterized protein GGS23DRAFT_530895 [Durotheca rogersii]KAI5863388.1 hypothetical protein GGS23DRAFT_530895 [Durotheca rogersii]
MQVYYVRLGPLVTLARIAMLSFSWARLCQQVLSAPDDDRLSCSLAPTLCGRASPSFSLPLYTGNHGFSNDRKGKCHPFCWPVVRPGARLRSSK